MFGKMEEMERKGRVGGELEKLERKGRFEGELERKGRVGLNKMYFICKQYINNRTAGPCNKQKYITTARI